MRRLTAAERTVLRGYVDGETIGDMAKSIGQPVGVVQRIITEMCHHSRPQARSRLAMDDELIEVTAEPAQSPAAARTEPPAHEPARSLERLLAAALDHESPRVRALADGIYKQMRELGELLDREAREVP
jgi:hypothetical protein